MSLGETRFVGVIDIGKTNAKFAVVDLETRSEIAVRRQPNAVRAGSPYPHFDIEGIWDFLCMAIAELNAVHPLDALSVTTHGACAALVNEAGGLALPVLDYEHMGPDEVDAEYAALRPAFSESFTPPLSGGLNLGKQIYWQSQAFPEDFARTRWILTYPQYWSFRLTGIAASEVTSLGCHTDLWDFPRQDFSSLVQRCGWRNLFPGVRPASAILGPVKPELAKRLGLNDETMVYSGIHDSNASLLPHVLERRQPFAVVSTGTWVIACAPGGDLDQLDPSRDSLANIDALGRHVPSARFMGGREFSQLTDGETITPSEAAIRAVLTRNAMLLPSVTEGSGPFPHRKARWTIPLDSLDKQERFAAVSFYLALMTAECLLLTGAAGDIVVEGPFAANVPYLQMLEAATGRPVYPSTWSATGTSIGAALLAAMEVGKTPPPAQKPARPDPAMAGYAQFWREAVRS